jgi:predicted transcriptional regulator
MRYGIVTYTSMHDLNLSLQAKGVYGILATYADKDGWCWPKVATLAEKSSVSVRTVNRALKELKQHGYVHREGKKFRILK